MGDVLEKILDAKRRSLEEAAAKVSLADLEARAKKRDHRDFFKAVSASGQMNLICEMKRRSPSAGDILPSFDPASIARSYEKGGAAALSVLTERDHFGGSPEDLDSARNACELPVLRKDFIFDSYQVVEARAFGADAVLLIAEMLSPADLKSLAEEIRKWEMEPLVEVFSSDSVPAALNTGARLIGINSRNLRTLEMKPDNTVYISRLIPKDRVIVAESGMKTKEDIRKMQAAGAKAALVGESLLKKPDLVKAVQELKTGASS